MYIKKNITEQSYENSLIPSEFAKHYTEEAGIALDKLENHCKEYNYPYNENMLNLAKMVVRHLYTEIVLYKICQDIEEVPSFWEECAKAKPQYNDDNIVCPWADE